MKPDKVGIITDWMRTFEFLKKGKEDEGCLAQTMVQGWLSNHWTLAGSFARSFKKYLQLEDRPIDKKRPAENVNKYQHPISDVPTFQVS